MQGEGVVARYVEHMGVRNLRRWTIYSRERALVRLSAYFDGPILYLTEQQLKDWQTARSKGIQAEPLRTETSHLRQFYGWAQREGYRVDDPTLRLIMPRVQRRLPRPISETHLALAMQHAEPPTHAILGLAAFAGLRACEIAQLDWSEVGLLDAEPHIRVEDGKGGKGRLVPMAAPLGVILEQLPARRGPVITRRDGAAGRVAAHRVSTWANDHLHSLGITATLHQCRHRFATIAYQATQDIRAVQELLGHASPTTTAIYAASASVVAIEAVRAAGVVHPTLTPAEHDAKIPA